MRMLIVEDEAGVAEFLKDAAKVKGHTDVDVAYSGEEAMTRAISA